MRIIKRHFRTQWEKTVMEDTTAKERLVNWLPTAALKRVRKLQGKYLSMSIYHYQRAGRLLPAHYEVEHQYDSGRVAYKFGEGIVVQTLNQGHLMQPRVYSEGNRIPIQDWLLSNDFLVGHVLGRYVQLHLFNMRECLIS
jgi:hypothetical protein